MYQVNVSYTKVTKYNKSISFLAASGRNSSNLFFNNFPPPVSIISLLLLQKVFIENLKNLVNSKIKLAKNLVDRFNTFGSSPQPWRKKLFKMLFIKWKICEKSKNLNKWKMKNVCYALHDDYKAKSVLFVSWCFQSFQSFWIWSFRLGFPQCFRWLP